MEVSCESIHIKRFLGTVSGRLRPLLITATFTGLRASELRGLRWQDVDLHRSELHVHQHAVSFGLGADGVGIYGQGAFRRRRQHGRRHTLLDQLLAQFVGIIVKAELNVTLVEDFD